MTKHVIILATDDNAILKSGGELISSSVSHRDSSSVLKNVNSDGTSLSSSSDGKLQFFVIF